MARRARLWSEALTSGARELLASKPCSERIVFHTALFDCLSETFSALPMVSKVRYECRSDINGSSHSAWALGVSELAVVTKLLRKNRDQHHAAQFFRKLVSAQRHLQSLFGKESCVIQDLSSALDSVRCSCGTVVQEKVKDATSGKTTKQRCLMVPCRRTFELAVLMVRSTLALLRDVQACLLDTAASLRRELELTYFMPFCFTMYASMSRFFALVEAWNDALRQWEQACTAALGFALIPPTCASDQWHASALALIKAANTILEDSQSSVEVKVAAVIPLDGVSQSRPPPTSREQRILSDCSQSEPMPLDDMMTTSRESPKRRKKKKGKRCADSLDGPSLPNRPATKVKKRTNEQGIGQKATHDAVFASLMLGTSLLEKKALNVKTKKAKKKKNR